MFCVIARVRTPASSALNVSFVSQDETTGTLQTHRSADRVRPVDYLEVIDGATCGDYSRGAMATASASLDVGPLLRKWRERRRRTQMELALDAGISARHLSFVETGRSKPGRAMLLGVTECLGVPYRERTEILLAAG